MKFFAHLYHLAQDIGETKNVASENPEIVKELSSLWIAWNSDLAEPKWLPGPRNRRNR